MKRLWASLIVVLTAVSCGGMNVKKISSDSDAILKVKKAGFIVRIARDVRLTREDYVKSISHWIAGFVPQKDLLFIADTSDKITYFNTNEDRFYQLDESGNFLRFKSTGVVNMYLRDNRDELKKLMADNSLDGLFIYEIYGVIANEMQFVDYDTMLVMTDKNLKVIYLDHQHLSDDTNELDFDRIKVKYMDSISERITRTLLDLRFLGK